MVPERILIIQTAFIGDAILATALLEALHRQFPSARLDIAVRAGNESLFRGHPFIGQVLIWNKKGGKYRNLLTLIRTIRAERYDLVVNLQRFFSTGLMTFLSGARQTVGFRKNPFSITFTHRVPHRIGDGTHEVERNLALVAHLTGRRYARPRLYPSEADCREGEASRPYICIAPSSVWATKQWLAERWVALIATVPQTHTIYLLGAPSDRGACAAIIESSSRPGVINRAGELSLLASAALMRGAEMNFVNDSAPLHLASAVNAPVTAIFCSTVPAFGFGPLSDTSIIWQTPEDLDCRPCGLHGHSACPRGHFRCADIPLPPTPWPNPVGPL